MSVPTQVVKLVEQFKEERQAVKSPQYKEAWGRIHYIDPFFKALGWDVHNEKSGTLIYKEVVHEDFLRVEGAMKAPDYCFYNGGARKFFVEAKKPSVNLLDGKAAAFQVRRYAWSAKLPLSVLTDFEELAIYDCHFRPLKEDKASTARSLYMTYEEYPDRWDEIASLFSKDAVLSGSLDAYSQNLKKKRGITTVDEAFLKEMEGWREILAKDLAKRNPSLKRRELNYAVQMTIDRIVFLRICEDRGIEDYGKLEDLVNRNNVYDKLRDAFKDADDKYNSGLFHFREEKGREELPDDLTLSLQLSDQPLKKIIKGLYYPESPYQFSVMPVEIMGQVYEQFLGKVISVDPDHRVVIEEKPEVRKAGGVYYTPAYIVDYIVENTVGKLLEGKTPQQASKLRILDPACGSGSFLIGAYTYLLDWHRRWYVDNASEKERGKVLYEGPSGEWQLTTAKKKEILLNNIYGVDIDVQAVEVTKLSLLLKVLEGETNESINSQLTFLKERALPDLDNNIKWGNSLIGWDFYDNAEMKLLDEEELYGINVFDWKANFPQVFTGNKFGFDAVIGNPPYDVMEKQRGASSWPHTALSEYVKAKPEYEPALGGKLNLFRFFVVRSLRLVRDQGYFGMIVPLAIIADISSARIRRYLMLETSDLTMDCFPQKDNPRRRVFLGAKLSTVVVTCQRVATVTEESAQVRVRVYPWNKFDDDHTESVIRLTDTALLDPKNAPIPLVDSENWSVCRRVHSAPNIERLGAVGDFSVTRGEINQTINRHFITDDPTKARLLKGVEVGRFHLNRELSQGYREWFDEESFLSSNVAKSVVKQRRIATQRITGIDERLRIVAAFIDPPTYFADSTNSIRLDGANPLHRLEYVLGLLNSRFFQWRFKLTSTNNNVGTNELDSMPFRTIDFSDHEDVAHHDRMVELVQRMLSLHERLAAAKLNQEKTVIQHQIDATDRQIDRLVYELYGLSLRFNPVSGEECGKSSASA